MKRPHIFFCNEHNNAFSIIEKAKWKGIIGKKNTILHFDAHEDMRIYSCATSLYDFQKGNKNKIDKYAKNELLIDSFIKNLILLGTINSYYWIFPSWKKIKQTKLQTYLIGSHNAEGKTFEELSGNIKENKNKVFMTLCPDFKEYTHQIISINKSPKKIRAIIDIDFDYFICNIDVSSRTKTKIEITKKEYLRAQKEEYFPLQTIGIRRKLMKRGNKFFVELFDVTNGKGPQWGFCNIEKEIYRIFETIQKNNVTPEMFIMARSNLSHYTPLKKVKFIEDKMRTIIKEYYPNAKFNDEM